MTSRLPSPRSAVLFDLLTALLDSAAERIPVRWDVIVSAEDAGYYKPDPRPYRLALSQLGVEPQRALFVAGSGYDLFGTAAVGLPTFWHNRVGLPRPEGAPAPDVEAPDLSGLPG